MRDLASEIRFFSIEFTLEDCRKYIDRLEAIGFSGQGANVLDAGCGFGQWSLAMSSLIGYVVGIDVSAVRVEAVKKISLNIENVEFQKGSISKLPFPDNHFDFVFHSA